MADTSQVKRQTMVGLGILALGLGLGAGAYGIPSDAGYAGVGPNFLPWVVSGVLVICGGWVIREARTGGFHGMEPPSGAEEGYWPGFVWVSGGLLLNALLLTTIGFILSCTLCFTLAVRGLRSAEGRADMSAKRWAVDMATGAAIASPVYWMFTKLLAINLPGLTSSGWL
jgi:putative tricarboxylic transport membrane protein